jgi:murein DD-endopeptidase MepM/ murein hydrolase activator NlpD
MALLPGDRRVARIRFVTTASFVLIAIAATAAVAVFWPDLRHSLKSAKVTLPRAAALQKPVQEYSPPDEAPSEAAEDKATASVAPLTKSGTESERVAVGDAVGAPAPEGAPEMQPVLVNDPANASENERAGRQTKRGFGNAPGFREALRAAGLSRPEANELTLAFKNLVDFRRCRPEHELVFERDSNGLLARFDYRVSLFEIYRAERDRRGTMHGRKIVVPIEKRRIAKGGYVSNSLGQSLENAGLGKSFAGIFVEAFEGHIDFRRDARTGDRFKAVVDGEYLRGSFLRYGTIQALEYVGQRKGTERAFWYVPKNGKGDYFDVKGRTMQGGWLKTPLRYDYISSRYDLKRKHPLLHRIIPHQGIDYAASPGTAVRAAADGTVTFSGEKNANGKLIVLSHQGGYESCYAHLLRIAREIKPGAKVKQRQYLGSVGSTGLSTGPHLHFALRYRGRFIDPASQLNGPGKPLSPAEMGKFRAIAQNLNSELNRIHLSPAPENTGTPLPSPPPTAAIEGTESF